MFFIVLDLRLTKVGVQRNSFFMLFSRLFLLYLFWFQAVYRVVTGCPVILYSNGYQCNQTDYDACNQKYPWRNRDFFIELFQPFRYGIPGDGTGQEWTDDGKREVGAAEHPKNLSRGGSIYFSYPDFLTAVCGFKNNQSEYSYQWNQNGKQTEPGDYLLLVCFFLVKLAVYLVGRISGRKISLLWDSP